MANALAELFQDQANAIREGLGDIGKIAPSDYATRIREINALIGSGSSDDVLYVTFMNGSTELLVKPVAVGDDCADVVARGLIDAPTKESTEQYAYDFLGWSTTSGGSVEEDALKNVSEDRTLYAVFNAVTLYKVRFYNDSTLLQTVFVRYGEDATYTESDPDKGADYEFTGWKPVPENITTNTDCYAQFRSTSFDFSTTDFSLGYGVEWDYSQTSSALTRIGLSSGLSNPTPSTSLTENGSSPFDNVMPWSGMKKYNIIDGAVAYSEDDAGFSMTDYDTMVYIPPFYYAAYKDADNTKWRWSISPTEKEGYALHPGSGRYIGRYHTSGSSSALFSKSGVQQFTSQNRSDFRTYSHNKGNEWWMLDIATWAAIQLLYLVEFADFNSQLKIGCGNGTSSQTSGSTDTSVYHTYNGGDTTNQYRWIEQPWGGGYVYADGFVAVDRACYVGINNSMFADETTNLKATGITLPESAYIKGFGYCIDYPWAFLPDTASGYENQKNVTDQVNSGTGTKALYFGGNVANYTYNGMFFFGAGSLYSGIGSRLIYIP